MKVRHERALHSLEKKRPLDECITDFTRLLKACSYSGVLWELL